MRTRLWYAFAHSAAVAVFYTALQYCTKGSVNVDVLGGYVLGVFFALLWLPDAVRQAK
jgi:cytochrome c biogenesis protein CcdA